jgi:hypothetical protein
MNESTAIVKIWFMTYNSACVRTTENHRLGTAIACLRVLWPVRVQTTSLQKSNKMMVSFIQKDKWGFELVNFMAVIWA